MTTAKEARAVNELVDAIAKGYQPNEEELNHLRSFLPERPKPVTLEQLRDRVHAAWGDAGTCTWDRDEDLDDFLLALRDDLSRLINEPKPAAPSLPAGMRLAEHEDYGRVVVSPKVNMAGRYEVFYLVPSAASGTDLDEVEPGSLTFIDAEPAKPVHPEFLETEADYQKAPEGTIVVLDGGTLPFVKDLGWPMDMSHIRRRLLRWGWGE